MEKITHKSRSSKEDLTGQTFGLLTAICPNPEGTGDKKRWLCRCNCGNECVVLASNLVRGHTKSCGCLKQRDLTGQRINMLTVLERSDNVALRGNRKVSLWKCRCDSSIVHIESCIFSRLIPTGIRSPERHPPIASLPPIKQKLYFV